jgi:hypothetical protein
VLRAALYLLCLGWALWATPGAAQPTAPSDDPRARALELGREGVDLYNQERFVEANERFERAERLVHSPVFLVYMARCKVRLKALLAARALYRRALGEALPSDAPDAWREALEDGDEELALLERRIPSLWLKVRGRDAARARVSLDERRIERAEWARPIEVDPGRHTLAVDSPGSGVVRQTVEVGEGESVRVVEIDLAQAGAPAGALVAVRVPPEPERNTGLIAAGATLMGVGGIAVFAGAIAAILYGTAGSLYPDSGPAAIALLVGGGVFLAAGIPMLVVGLQEKPAETKEARHPLRLGLLPPQVSVQF